MSSKCEALKSATGQTVPGVQRSREEAFQKMSLGKSNHELFPKTLSMFRQSLFIEESESGLKTGGQSPRVLTAGRPFLTSAATFIGLFAE